METNYFEKTTRLESLCSELSDYNDQEYSDFSQEYSEQELADLRDFNGILFADND